MGYTPNIIYIEWVIHLILFILNGLYTLKHYPLVPKKDANTRLKGCIQCIMTKEKKTLSPAPRQHLHQRDSW